MDLILARHGQSEGNLDYSKGPDTPLTDLGRRQAERLGGWLADQFTFTAFYASPLLRARQTAEIVNRSLSLPIIYDEDLSEAPIRYENPRPARPVAGLGAPAVLSPSYATFYTRVARAGRRVIGPEPEGTVLVIAHAGTIGTLVRTLLGVHDVFIGTHLASTHHFRWSDGRWFMVFLNRNHYLSGLEA